MKNIAVNSIKVAMLLVLFVCCSINVCSGINKHVTCFCSTAVSKSVKSEKILEEIRPNQLAALRIMELL